MTWTITKTIPTLAASDLDLGIEFYRRLGFQLDWKYPDDDPTHAGLMLGECSIMLSRCDPTVQSDVYFIVDDVRACHVAVLEGRAWEIAAEAGATAQRPDCPPARALQEPAPPTDQPYGLCDFSVIDPWGHALAFGEPLAQQA